MIQEQTLSAAAAGEFTIGGDLTVNRMGYGAMRITGQGIWDRLLTKPPPLQPCGGRLNSA